MKRNKQILKCIIYLVMFGSLFNRYVGYGEYVSLITDILVFYLAARIPLQGHLEAMKIFVTKPLFYLVLVFFGFAVFTSIFNTVPFVSFLWGMKMILRYVLVFYSILRICKYSDTLYFRKILYTSFTINTIFCVVQTLMGERGDFLGGIFSGNGDLAFYMIVCCFVFFCDYLQHKMGGLKFSLCFIIMFYFSMVGEIKLMYVMLPLTVYSAYFMVKKKNANMIIVTCLFAIFLVPFIRYTLSYYYDDNYIRKTLDRDEVGNYVEGSGYGGVKQSINRNSCIEMTNTILLKNTHNLLAGYGLGSGSASDNFGTEIYKQYKETNYYYFTTSYVLVELGWIGYILFLCIYIFIFLRFLHLFRTYRDYIIKFWTSLGLFISLVTFIMIWYAQGPYADYYFAYIIWGMCIVAIYERVNQLRITAKVYG